VGEERYSSPDLTIRRFTMYNYKIVKQYVGRRQFLRIVSVGGGMLALNALMTGCGQIIARNAHKVVPLAPAGAIGARTRLEKALSKLDPTIVTEAVTASKSFLQVTMGNQRGRGKISEASRNFYIKANRFIDHLDSIGLLRVLEDESFAIIELQEQEKAYRRAEEPSYPGLQRHRPFRPGDSC